MCSWIRDSVFGLLSDFGFRSSNFLCYRPPVVRLLDRYLFRELLLPLTYCVVGFLLCFTIFDLFSQIDDFQRNKLLAADIFDYYANHLPELVVTSYVMPMALLLALLYALTNHARHNELTAMRAAGVSLGRISAPYFIVGILFSIIVLVLNESVVPDAADNAERILLRRVGTQGKSRSKIVQSNVSFANDFAGRTWHIVEYNLQTRHMLRPQIYWKQRDGSHRVVFAEEAFWFRRHWVFTNVQQFIYAPNNDGLPTEKYVTNRFDLPPIMETPRLIASEIKISGLESLKSLRKTQLSSGAILDYLKLHPNLEPKKEDALLTLLHSRIAAPWTCLVVVLIAVPFGALPGRRNAFVGVASSISICFAFFVAKDLTLALGSGGWIPAWLAAWAPNTFFALTGIVLMWRVR
jgi:lipopolysaccharide export system permease protein